MYTVWKDSREKPGQGWTFENMVTRGLKTGDYTLEGYETLLTIERKGTSGEFANNIVEKRFERELERMSDFKWAYIILEFDLIDVMNFPDNSGIPRKVWPKLRITPKYMLKKLAEYQVKYTPKIIFASRHGWDIADAIFKEVVRAGN